MSEAITRLYLENGGKGYAAIEETSEGFVLEYEHKVTAYSKPTREVFDEFESAVARAMELMFPELHVSVGIPA